MWVNLCVFNGENRSSCSGFSLLELAIVLTVIGLLATAAASVYRPAAGVVHEHQTIRLLQGIQQACVAFAVSHRRLPCADTNGNGFEGAGSGCGTTGGFQTGRVPYATLGIPLSGAPGADALSANIVYGVYRNMSADADLAIAKERTGDLPGVFPGYDDLGDFRKALVNAETAAVSNAFVYVTGVGISKNCTVTQRNVAFVLASAGAADADNDGNLFDDINAGLALTGGGSKCFASPGQRHSGAYDDRTLAMSFGTLAGALNTDINE